MSLIFRVIDNKKVALTPDESLLYDQIVASYTTQFSKGQDLFIDLFDSNNDGMIVSLKPPSKRQTSLEVYLFLVNIFIHQHLRNGYNLIEDACTQLKQKIQTLDQKIEEINSLKKEWEDFRQQQNIKN